MAFSKKRFIKIFTIIVGLVVFSILLNYSFLYYKGLKSPSSPVIAAIPPTAALIIELNKPLDINNKLSTQTSFWESLTQITPFNHLKENINFLDSIALANEEIKNIFQNSSVFISIHPSAQNYAHSLFLADIGNNKKQSFVFKILKKAFTNKAQINTVEFKGFEIIEFKYNTKLLSFAVFKGVLMCSQNRQLVEDALLQLSQPSIIETDKSFNNVASTLGKKVDGNLYVNFKNFHRLLIGYFDTKQSAAISFLSSFAHWSGLDINIKNEALIFNGYTDVADTSDSFLNLFVNQEPQKADVTSILPFNTSSFVFLGFSNFSDYSFLLQKHLSKTNKISDYNIAIENFSKNYDINTDTFLIENIHNEVCFATVQNSLLNKIQNYFVVKFKSKDLLTSMHNKLIDQVDFKLYDKKELTKYREFDVGYMGEVEIFNTILGTSFNLTSFFSYCIIDNYLIFGQSRDDLVAIINAHLFKKSLSNNVQFTSFFDLLSSKSNIQIFYNLPQSINHLKSYCNNDINKYFDLNAEQFNPFDAMAFQISRIDKRFYTHVCINYNPNPQTDISNTLWETEIDNKAGHIFTQVINHNDNSVEVIMNDVNHNVYLIDKNGLVLWKKEIGEPIISSVHQIDYYGNGKYQFLFNTATHAYLLDRNGNNVAAYPIKFKDKATNGVAVFDYDSNRNYRFFIATENNEILNLDKDWKIVKGWKIFKTNNHVEKELQFLRLLGKDFIFVTESTGQFHILDRRGDVRVKTDTSLRINKNTVFFPFITSDKKGLFKVNDTTGKIISIDFNGRTEITSYNSFSKKHFFVCQDINNNSLKEYTFIDGNKVYFYNYAKELIKTIELNTVIDTEPIFFNANKKFKLGLISKDNEFIYLINSDLELHSDFPISGSSTFFVIETAKDKKNYLLAVHDKIVFKYFLE